MTDDNRQFETCVAVTSYGALDLSAKSYDLNAFGKLWAAGMEGRGGGSELTEPGSPYEQSLWVFRCISEIQRTISGVPLRLAREGPGLARGRKSVRIAPRRGVRTLKPMRGHKGVCIGRAAEGELVEAGEAFGLLENPNTYQSWAELIVETVGWLYLHGSVAWIFCDLEGRRPGEIHAVGGRCVTRHFSQDEHGCAILEGYTYRAPRSGKEIPLAPDEVHYWETWRPTDDKSRGGLSPLVPGRLAISTEYSASLFNASALHNGTEVGLTVTFPGSLDDGQRDEYRAVLTQRHRGPANARKPLILENGATAEAMQASMVDLQFDQGKKTTRTEICCFLGVPPVVAGWLESAADSSAYAQNSLRQFYQQTIFPLLDFLLPGVIDVVERIDTGVVPFWDVEDQPVVQEMRICRVDTAVKLAGLGVPLADSNEQLDMGLPPRPWYDTGFMPAGLMPAQDLADGAGAFPPMDEGPGGEPEDLLGEFDLAHPSPATALAGISPSARPPTGRMHDAEIPPSAVGRLGATAAKSAARIWSAWERSWAPLAKSFKAVLRGRYMAQLRRLKAAVKRHAPDAKAAVKAPSIVGRILAVIESDRKSWNLRVRKFVSDAGELGLRQALVEAGLSGDDLEAAIKRLMSDPRITRALKSQALKVSTRVDRATRKVLRTQLSDGVAAGETPSQLADRVQGVMQGRRSDALRVARNHVGQSLSISRHAGHEAVGMTHKVWLHSRGPGIRRPGHVAAEARYASKPIPIDKPFVVNGYELMYPRDPAGPPGEVINCQCMDLAKRGKAGKGMDLAELLAHYEHVAASPAWRGVPTIAKTGDTTDDD